MPLDDSCSLEAYKANISAEVRAGKTQEQAVAIAASTLRKACGEKRADKMLANVKHPNAILVAQQECIDVAIAAQQPAEIAALRKLSESAASADQEYSAAKACKEKKTADWEKARQSAIDAFSNPLESK